MNLKGSLKLKEINGIRSNKIPREPLNPAILGTRQVHAHVKPGAAVVVVGDGAVGPLVLSAKQMGPERTVAMSRRELR